MKKIIALLLAFALGIAVGAYGSALVSKPAPEPAAEPTPAPTPVPTAAPTPEPVPTPEPEPLWEPGSCRLGNWGLLWTTYRRGDEVTLLGRWNDYYIIQGRESKLLVEKRFLRWDGEEVPGERDGWTYADTAVYPSGYLFGAATDRLPLNTKVRVIDTKANWAYIAWDGGTGYVDPADISGQPAVANTGGNAGGGHAGGTPALPGVPSLPSVPSAPGGGNQDGTDVNMDALALKPAARPALSLLTDDFELSYEEFSPCPAVILSDETEAYLCFLHRGDALKVTEAGEEECSVLINGLEAKLVRWAVHMETDEAYAPWLAYTNGGAVAYTEYQRNNRLAEFTVNDRVWVVDELKELGLYVVEIDGVFGYMKIGELSAAQIPAYAGGGGSHPPAAGGDAPPGGALPPLPGTDGSTGGSGGDWTPPSL